MAILPSIQSDLIYRGVWQNFSAPAYRRWSWTVPNMTALVILGILMVLGTFAQGRAWVVLRRIVTQLTTPVRLPDDSDPVSSLTQKEALSATIKSFQSHIHRRNLHDEPDHEIVTVSPWFGVLCIINATLFAGFGMFIPWFLAEGLQGEAVVRYQPPPYQFMCSSRDPMALLNFVGADVFGLQPTEISFRKCQEGTSKEQSYCDGMMELPDVKRERLPLLMLNASTHQFLLEHSDHRAQALRLSQRILPRQLGINGDDHLALSHELTCVPFDLHKFIDTVDGNYFLDVSLGSVNYTRSFPQVTARPDLTLPQISSKVQLLTSNGPSSGHEAFYLTNYTRMYSIYRESSFSVLPELIGEVTPQSIFTAQSTDLLSRFLVTFRSGRILHSHSIYDPLFSAQTKIQFGSIDKFVADREVTAIGCVENFAVCSSVRSTEHCYSRLQLEGLRPNFTGRNRPLRIPQEVELGMMLFQASSFFSVASDLPRVRGVATSHAMPSPWPTNVVEDYYLTDDPAPWEDQVDHIFNNSASEGRFGFKAVVERFIRLNSVWKSPDSRQDFRHCNPLLFRNLDYTNINIVGLCSVLFSFLLICLISYTPSPIFEKLWTKAKDWIEGPCICHRSYPQISREERQSADLPHPLEDFPVRGPDIEEPDDPIRYLG